MIPGRVTGLPLRDEADALTLPRITSQAREVTSVEPAPAPGPPFACLSSTTPKVSKIAIFGLVVGLIVLTISGGNDGKTNGP